MSVLNWSLQRFGGPDLTNVEVTLNRSELFRAECNRLMLETEKACKRMQNDDSKRLDQRVRDIQFLRKELELKLEEIIPEIDLFMALRCKVMKALEMVREAQKITICCLNERRKRDPSDRVYDEVNAELLKECETFEDVAQLLRNVQEQISEQIRLNRSIKYHLEQDLKEKCEAESTDNSCALMTIYSMPCTDLEMARKNISLLSSSPFTPMQWENITDLNIAKAEQQKNNSLALRILVESVLVQISADVDKQFKATTEAFQLNIQQLKSVKNQMEEKLPKILTEITNQQMIREDLQRAIVEHEHFLTLAQCRLVLRHERPGKEECYDPAQAQLIAEVQQLTTHINKLHEEVAHSEEEERALVRCQVELKENIDIKAKSICIDEVICMQLREAINLCNI
ncbi:tektin-1 [Anableps anableps]